MRKERGKRSPLPVSAGGGAITYLITLLLFYVLARSVTSPLTHTLFRLCLFMPFLSILLLVISAHYVGYRVVKRNITVSRNQSSKYTLTLGNYSVIPVSAVKMTLSLFDPNGERRTVRTKKSIALPPFSEVNIEFDGEYVRRGRFDIGTDAIFIYDMLHIIKIRKRVYGKTRVSVLPAVMTADDHGVVFGRNEDESLTSSDIHTSYDYGDIREYRAGDSMKRIHWKLSTKSEELLVKRSVAPSDSKLCLLIDRQGYDPGSGISILGSLELDDRTVELCAEVLSGVKDGMRGCVIVDTDDGRSKVLDFDGERSAEDIRFSLCSLELGSVSAPLGLIPENTAFLVYALTYYSPRQVDKLLRARELVLTRDIMVLCVDASEFVPEEKRTSYRAELEDFSSRLNTLGISLTIFRRRDGE